MLGLGVRGERSSASPYTVHWPSHWEGWPSTGPPPRTHDPSVDKGGLAALRLAELGRPVKIMAGGITGWIDEGFALVREDETV